MAMHVRSAAMVAVVAGLAARTSADTFTFSNDCGSGMWGTLCPIGGGVYQSNWGRSGAPTPALLPGAADSVNIVGTVTLDVNPTVVLVTIPAGATLNWPGASLTGTVSNSGTVFAGSGFNKFLAGSATNNSGGAWTISEGSFYLTPGSLTNAVGGTLTLASAGSVRRNAGNTADCLLDNRGTLRVSGGNSTVSSVTVSSQTPGVWLTDVGASLTFDSVLLNGLISGDHDGTTNMVGSVGLAGDTQLATAPGSNPWRWTSANMDTGAFTLTNTGWLRLDSGFNKFIKGTAVNASTGVWTLAEGNFYFNPDATQSTISNGGLIEIGAAGLRRNGGAIENAVLGSSGTVRATGGAATLSDITLASNGGTWATMGGATLNLAGVRLSGLFVGDHAGSTTMTDTVALAADTTFTSTVAGASPWGWTSASMNTGAFTFTNAGRLTMTTGFNKFLSGSAVNGPGAVWTLAEGNFYMNPTVALTTITNSGTVSMGAGVGLRRNGGAAGDARLITSGVVASTGPNAVVQGVSITSNSGIWRTSVGASLMLDADNLAGTLVGDHAGDATLSGAMLLTADAALATLPASAMPWLWTSASFDANGFTLTNLGRVQTTTGFNKFLTGAAVNAAGATIDCTAGNLYLSPGGSTGIASLTNNGTITMTNGASIFRNGGSVATATLTNNGLVQVPSGASRIDGMTFNNGAAGVIRVEAGATLTLQNDWSMGGGRFEGSGSFHSGGLGFVNAGGTVAPGLGPVTGTLTSSHRYNQLAGGTLEIGIVSNGVTQTVDKLALSSGGFNGRAALDGTLRVTLPAGVSPPPIGGVDMLIVDAPGGLTGQFTSVVEADPIENFRYMVVYTPTQAFLRVIRQCGGADIGSAGADANFDGQLDNNDFIVYIDRFFAQDPRADVGIAGGAFGSDGLFDNNDFIAFIDLFFSGCH